MLKPLPTSTANFRQIIEGNFVYIDKTRYVYELVKNSTGAWFLARPRRFGKTLLVSTLEALFNGARDLFRGLWIDSSDYQWERYPIIRLNMNLYPAENAAELQQNIKRYLAQIAQQYGVTLTDAPYYAQFGELILTLAKYSESTNQRDKRVVILIDEYDKPLIDHLDDLPEAIQIRKTLKGFYGVLKAMEESIRMVFITGISKFSKVGVFSDLNHLTDLTMNPDFAAVVGLTEAEIRNTLAEYVTLFAQKERLSDDALIEQMRDWYNGFRFSAAAENVYNPYSTLTFFYQQRFSNYWFESGSPTFLINLIRRTHYNLEELNDLKINELAFSTYEIERLAIVPLLFQTGYLTIKEYDPASQHYRLDFPNYEVKNAFLVYLLDAFSKIEQGLSEAHVWQLLAALKAHNLKLFFNVLKVFFANIDYDLHLEYEKYYQTIFYLIFKLLGVRIDAEIKTNTGRIDAVIELVDHIYLFEFKLDQSATVAMKQVRSHAYYQKYLLHGKPITYIGANFNTKSRSTDGWKQKQVKPLI